MSVKDTGGANFAAGTVSIYHHPGDNGCVYGSMNIVNLYGTPFISFAGGINQWVITTTSACSVCVTFIGSY